MKKVFTLLTLALLSIGSAWAAAVGDLKTISTDYVFIADNFTSNGTVGLSANTLYDGNVLFTPTGNTVASNKGNCNFEGANHLNSLRVKNTQDQFCFKVSGACTVTFYTQSHGTRGIQVGSTAGGTQYGSQTANTSQWSCEITDAGVVYLSSYGGDFYFAGFIVTFPKTGQPTISNNPANANYSQGDAATELSISATAAAEGALSYQWYKNETNKSALEAEGATAIDGATNATYTPSTSNVGTTYYFCKVTEAGNENIATSRIAEVTVIPTGFTVTYSLGDVTGTVGTVPEAVGPVNSLTIPTNNILYKDGYTLTAWNDGSANHAVGSDMDVTANTTLTPVFTENGASSYLGHNASTATWDFQTANGAPTWSIEGFGTEKKEYYVTQTSVGGSNIDLLMTIDATNGKFNNASWTDWAQVNENTVLTVPVIVGATLQLFVMSEGSTPVTFGGDAGTYASNIYSYTATTDGALDIVIGEGQGYARYLTVTYPSESAVLNVTANNTEIGLTRDNINSVDYLAVSTNNWSSSQTIGDYTGEFYNLSSTDRKLTIKVTGAKLFEVFVKNNTADRKYSVKVGDGDATEITHGGTGVESSGVFAIADPSVVTTITLSGGGNSVYPAYINFDPVVTITPAKEYTTFVATKPLDFDGTGLTAYKATAATTAEVTMMPVTAVPAGTPLVLKKGTEDSYDVPVVASADAITDNLLKASDGVTPIGGDGVWDYILSDGLFYRATEGVLAKGKAYLHLDAAPADAARELVMSFGDEATGIDSVTRNALTNGKVYNLQGQEVKNAQKGIFIVNGKKVVLK